MAKKSLRNIIQKEAYHLIFLQLAGVVILACLTLLPYGIKNGLSVLAGGVAYVVPNFIFVGIVFRYVGAQSVMQFITAFYFGEMIKLVASAGLVLVIVKYLPVSLLSTLIGFIAAIVSFWVACMWHFSKQPVTKSRAAE